MESVHQPHILVVDDNLAIRNLVATILGEHGMEVTAVSDGNQALAYLDRRRPDLMLLDLSMPHLDGLEVLRRVREHPTLHDLRIVMLTAVASTQRFKEVNAYQTDGFVEKPFRIDDLIDQVKRALTRQPTRQARDSNA